MFKIGDKFYPNMKKVHRWAEEYANTIFTVVNLEEGSNRATLSFPVFGREGMVSSTRREYHELIPVRKPCKNIPVGDI